MNKNEILAQREALMAKRETMEAKLGELAQRETLNDTEKAQYEALKREYSLNLNQYSNLTQMLDNVEREVKVQKDADTQMREAIKSVREHTMNGEIKLQRTATVGITSSVIQTGEKTNMESAGIPVTINDLINPMEMGLIYDKLGLKVATNVHGKLVWPCLDTTAECSVGGELDAVDTITPNFSKITPTPFKLGISVEISNEAINDESFDLVGTIKNQMNVSLGRTLNKRVLALAAPSAKPAFVGPLKAIATATGTTGFASKKITFAGAVPTYAELKALKAKVLATGAEMMGFAYVMDAAMYSALEATSKDTGSGRFIIEGGKIDGDLVFLTSDTAYAGKIAAGCFAYEALNQHGDAYFIIDPYSKAKNNVTVFTLNADFSLTQLVSETNLAKDTPFAVGIATA